MIDIVILTEEINTQYTLSSLLNNSENFRLHLFTRREQPYDQMKPTLDWAMKNGQISVWAPSKMVLDATHPPQGDLRNSLSLTHWLIDLLEAQDGLYIGVEVPVDSALRLRSQPIQAQLL